MTTNGTASKENPMEKMTSDASERMEKFFEDYKQLEAQQHERTVEMIEEGAKMMKASMAYSLKMTEEWRKMAVQANKQAAELFTTKWF